MRVDLGVKPYMYPQMVLIIGTYDEAGRNNKGSESGSS